MPAPADVTPEFLAGCDREMERFRAEQRAGRYPAGQPVPDVLFEVQGFRMTWVCGVWLHKKLLEAGATDEEAGKACFANGQRLFGAADPWAPTVRALSRWLADRAVTEPGPDLAERLIAGTDPG